ncbi:MAG: hypothetical protein ACRYGI_11360 [Janthinobacterium lividum]
MAQHARDEAGNIWDVTNPASPVLVTAAHSSGGIVTKLADPKIGSEVSTAASRSRIEGAAADVAAPKSQAELQAIELENTQRRQKIAEYNEDHTPVPNFSPTSGLRGQAYFDKFHVPPQQQSLIKALVQGQLPAGQRSIASKTMLPLIQQAVNYDPSFSATTFQQRSDFFKNVVGGKDGLALDAAGTAMGHAYKLRGYLGNLNNHNGIAGVLDGVGNAINQNVFRTPAAGTAESELSKFSKENASAYGQSVGAERAESKGEIPLNASPEQMYGALKGDVDFYGSKLSQLDTKGKRILGPDFDIKTYLSPEAHQSLDYYTNLDVKDVLPDGTHKGDKPYVPGFGMSAAPALSGTNGGPPAPPTAPQGGGNGGDSGGTIASGATRTVPIVAANAIINDGARRGRSLADVNADLTSGGFQAIPPDQAANYASSIAYAKAHPEYTGGFGNATRTVDNDLKTQFAGSKAGGAAGSFALNALDSVTGGYLDELTGAQTQMAKDVAARDHPLASILGGASGAAAAMLPIGRAAEAIGAGSRIGGLLVGTGARAAATGDALYGGILGSGEDNDNRIAGLLTGAATGLAGNVAGGAIARGAGAAVRGVVDPAVQYLTDRGIPLTIGQTLGNRGFIGRQMNKLESLPGLDALIGARRADAGQAYVRETINDALDPIGGAVTGTGQAAIGSAQGQVSQAYRDALANVNVTADAPFMADMGGAMTRGRAIPVQGEQFGHVMDSQVGPLFGPGGTLNGDTAQAALQAVRQAGSDFSGEGAMGRLASNETGNVDDAISSLLARQAPEAAQGLTNANAAYARMAPLNDAAITAVNNGGIYTPAQSIRAVTSNTKNFGGKAAAAQGQNVTDLMRYGQEVLPSTTGNSGSADRIAAMLLPSVLSGGAGYEALSGAHDEGGGIPTSALVLGALAAASSRSGGRVLQRALVDRPDALRRIGSSLIDNSQIGSAAVAPLALGYGVDR